MRFLFFFLLSFSLPLMLWAQDPNALRVDTQYVSVLLAGGKRYVGWMVRSDSASIVLSTTRGVEVNIERASIKQIRIVSEAYFRRQQRSPADATTKETYFVNPSAYGPTAGEGYFASNYIFIYQGNYGITDNISVRAGGFLVPMFVAPKLSVPVVHNRLALGVEGIIGFWMPFFFNFSATETDRSLSFSALRGIATIGNRATHLTASIGWASGGKRWAPSPIYGLAASWRVSPKFGLMTENYVFRDDDLVRIHWLGGRIYTRPLSFDLGLAALENQPVIWYGMAFHIY
jgi:hypothetical protein